MPPLPTAASTPSFRTRFEFRGRSQTGQKKKSSEMKGSDEYKTNDVGKATTPSEEGKMGGEETSANRYLLDFGRMVQKNIDNHRVRSFRVTWALLEQIEAVWTGEIVRD